LRKGEKEKGDRKQETGNRGQFRLIVTALRTSPAGKRSPSGINGIFSAVIALS